MAFAGCSYYLSNAYQAQKKQRGHETVYDRIQAGKSISYLVVGDSIGRGSGASSHSYKWFKQLEHKMLQANATAMRGNQIVQSGATAFEGLFKLQTTKQEYPGKYDLVFVVFGENDRKYMNAHEFGVLYEALIRKIKVFYPKADIITVTENPLRNQAFIEAIETISAHYQASNVNMAEAFRATGKAPASLTKDGVHPNDEGYTIYAGELYKQLMANTRQKKKIAGLTRPLFKDSDITFDLYTGVTKQKGFLNTDNYYTSETKGSYIEFPFYGSLLGIKLLRSPAGGQIKVLIDGKYYTTVSTWWPFQRERYIYIASGLSPGKHTVRFEATGESSKNNISNKALIQLSSVIMTKKIEGKPLLDSKPYNHFKIK